MGGWKDTNTSQQSSSTIFASYCLHDMGNLFALFHARLFSVLCIIYLGIYIFAKEIVKVSGALLYVFS